MTMHQFHIDRRFTDSFEGWFALPVDLGEDLKTIETLEADGYICYMRNRSNPDWIVALRPPDSDEPWHVDDDDEYIVTHEESQRF